MGKPMSGNVDIVTFGCRLNAYESEVMRNKAAEAGLDNAVIFNTCAVTAEAVRQARQAIRKTRRTRPDAKIIVTGCAAQIDAGAFERMGEVDRVLGNQEKLEVRSFDFSTADTERVRVNDIMALKETAHHLVAGFDGRARAFVQVQNGCDHRCTFCIIPFGRGNSRSVPAGAVVDQIRLLVDSGYSEVVLTGVDITSYGHDLPGTPGLGDLMRRILKLVPDLKRLRLSSIDSVEADDTLFDLIGQEPRLMPHFHLSLQAGSDMVLKRMKRRHTRADAAEFVDRVRRLRPDAVFGADIIAGFPTEDEAMFADSLSMIRDLSLTYLHVFPYSKRPGTPAARMPQVAGELIKMRAESLRREGALALARYLTSQIGQRQNVLIESPRLGRTEGFAPVAFDRDQVPGTIVSAIPYGADSSQLKAA
jgi:threonylcarbamoyladenosine tRNA methylthiotransferase MtaB